MTDFHVLSSLDCSVRIAKKGAELISLRNRSGQELIWPALPAWPRHAPNLFPIVGKLKDNLLRHQGQDYPLTQHGFARDMHFSWEERDSDRCQLSLSDNAATWLHYPFAFRFDVTYVLEGPLLSVTYTVTNTGNVVLPASFGAHPSFAWSLQQGIEKTDYYLEFESDEPGPLLRLENGLLSLTRHSNPIQDRMLKLDETFFIDDAMIFPNIMSKGVTFRTKAQKVLAMRWDNGFQHLGIWSKPGSDFLCIEPWQGLSSPVGFDGEISEKPEMLLISPGEKRSGTYCITAYE